MFNVYVMVLRNLVCSRGVDPDNFSGDWDMLYIGPGNRQLYPTSAQKVYKTHLLENLPGPRKCAKKMCQEARTQTNNLVKKLVQKPGAFANNWVNDMNQQPGPTTQASNLSQQYVPAIS